MTKTELRALFTKAHAAGKEAGKAAFAAATPMVVVQHASPLSDTSPVIYKSAPIAGGECGFAWVSIRPGTSAAAKYAKAHAGGKTDGYYGGVSIWVFEHGQSMAAKEAHAEAYAAVLSAAGIKAYAMSRID